MHDSDSKQVVRTGEEGWTVRRIGLFFAALVVFTAGGCAVHYYDAENNTEHIWGVGHMAMKVGTPNDGLKAVGRRTDVVGVAVGSLDKDVHLDLGWGAHQRVEVVDANTALWLTWPNGSFCNVRIGSKVPFELEHWSDSKAEEERP
jgi:hypothetical protein